MFAVVAVVVVGGSAIAAAVVAVVVIAVVSAVNCCVPLLRSVTDCTCTAVSMCLVVVVGCTMLLEQVAMVDAAWAQFCGVIAAFQLGSRCSARCRRECLDAVLCG